jgi:PAS domain S-box-containing protein
VKLRDLLIAEPVTCREDVSVGRVAQILKSGKVKNIPLVNEEGKVLGMVTGKSIAQALLEKVPPETPVLGFIEEVIQFSGETMLGNVLDYPLDRLVVVDQDQKFLGVISQEQLFSNLLRQRDRIISELNAILDGSNNSIIAINKEGRVIVYNKAAEKVLKVPTWEAIGRPIEELIPHTRLPEIVLTGKPQIGQRFVFDNSTFITNRTPIVRNGEVIGAVAIFQDITELQNIMEELTQVKEYQKILETILDNAYDGIVVVDANGIITMFNKAYAEFLKIPREKAVGKHVTQVIENTRMHIVAQTGKAEIGDVQRIHGNDMVCMRLPIEKDGKIFGAVGKVMFKDIKELTALAHKVSKLQTELEYYKDVVKQYQGARFTFQNIVGNSPQIQEIKTMAMRVARNNSTVLIRGESGTGKELFAHAIHYESSRKNGPFVKVNCAAIPENLLESELFGYEEGAFTGAKKGGKIGKFELANKGTIFLDEIGDMSLSMQVKLLRVLQEKEIERVGGTKSIPVDVRVLAATNRNLEELMEKNLFRSDLYYRLNVVELKIPPLRYRKEDIPALIHYLLEKLCTSMGYPVLQIDKEAVQCLVNYHWPGNIRELENVLERCLNLVEGGTINVVHLPFHIRRPESEGADSSLLLKNLLEETERMAIIKALEVCQGNKIKAAKMLGICRANIYQKLEKYGIV